MTETMGLSLTLLIIPGQCTVLSGLVFECVCSLCVCMRVPIWIKNC